MEGNCWRMTGVDRYLLSSFVLTQMVDRAFRFKRILCPVDFSPASLRALDSAIQLASLHGARIHVLHVVPRIVASLMDIPITTSRWTTADEERAKRELPKLKERARKTGSCRHD